MMSVRPIIRVAPLAIVLLVNSCGSKKEMTDEIIRPVRYTQVFATGGTRVRTFSGIAQAGVESSLSFKVPGTVVRVNVKIGDHVRRGQVLVELDANDYQLRVEEAEAALAQAQAGLRNARNTYDRVQSLYENRTASKQDLDGARAGYESASAQAESIERRLELARMQVSYTRLTAPYDGSVAQVTVEVNENVGSATPVVVLTAGSRPEVNLSIPEVLITQVRDGSSATASFDALPGRSWPATVTEVGVAPTDFATTFPVTVRLDDPTDEIRPGMAAEVSFRFETAGTEERLIVPAVSVGEDREGRYVFVVEPAEEGMGYARRRSVTIGELTSEGLEIVGGLTEGELVVTAGVTRIVDGQKVKLY